MLHCKCDTLKEWHIEKSNTSEEWQKSYLEEWQIKNVLHCKCDTLKEWHIERVTQQKSDKNPI